MDKLDMSLDELRRKRDGQGNRKREAQSREEPPNKKARRGGRGRGGRVGDERDERRSGGGDRGGEGNRRDRRDERGGRGGRGGRGRGGNDRHSGNAGERRGRDERKDDKRGNNNNTPGERRTRDDRRGFHPGEREGRDGRRRQQDYHHSNNNPRGRGMNRGPGQSPLGNKVSIVSLEDGGISFEFKTSDETLPLLQVDNQGQILVSCLKRDETTMLVCNMILRPLALQIISGKAQDASGVWYLSDGKDYKVKVIETHWNSGPRELELFKTRRAAILKELHDAKALYVDLSKHATVSTVTNAVTKLYLVCTKNHWQKPRLQIERVFKGETKGFVFKVSLPEFGIEIPTDMANWDTNPLVAKNKAALKALKTLESLKPGCTD